MQAISIHRHERRAVVLVRASVLSTAVLAGGCVHSLGTDDLPPLPVDAVDAVLPVDAAVLPADAAVPDAGPSDFAVRGTAAGVLDSVVLELRLSNEVELLSVTQDGTFTFDTRLEAGASYSVVLGNPSVPCTLRNETGVIAGADTAIELTCMGASLASVVLSGIVPPTVTLVPGKTKYVVDLSLLQQSVTLIATVAVPGDTMTIAGTPVASGAPSAELTLSLGDNPVDIVVENGLGWQRTYRLTLRRAAQLAQYAYGKASNTGVRDFFGESVALSGDTLAVGAFGEASASQGLNGNQDDNSAPYSGTVYVFRRTGTTWQQEAYLSLLNTERRQGAEKRRTAGARPDHLARQVRSNDTEQQSKAAAIRCEATGGGAGDSASVWGGGGAAPARSAQGHAVQVGGAGLREGGGRAMAAVPALRGL